MRLVTSPLDTSYGSARFELPAGERVVVPLWAVVSLTMALREHQAEPRVSYLGHYQRPYFGHDLTGKSLLAWRGHGIGDQLVFGGVLAWLKRRYPTARISLACHPLVWQALWEHAEGLPFDFVCEPIPLRTWQTYDYHLIGEGLCEGDREPDQPDIWTGLLQFAGIDPQDLSATDFAPVVPLSATDKAAASAWLAAHPVRPLIVWQLAASSPIRSYPPQLTRDAIAALAGAYPQSTILIVGHGAQVADYAVPAAGNVVIGDHLGLRTVFAVLAQADLLVCPDSCLGHVAAAFDTPTVSLWGSFSPEDRVGWYRSHRPLVGSTPCSPCRAHEQRVEVQGCPRRRAETGAPHFCTAIAQIAPELIIEAAKEIL